MGSNPYFSGIKITEVRVRNFRSLHEVNVLLDWLTVLIGENNAGKTSFLDSLFAAIGAGRHSISSDDIFVAHSETKIPIEREIVIDLLINPVDKQGDIQSSFPDGSYWIELWGEGISQDNEDNDFVAIRTQMKWDSTRGEYTTERRFLKDWQSDPCKWNQSQIKEHSISSSQIEPLALHLLDAKRDIKDELQNRGSFWYKLVSDLGLNEKEIDKFEKILSGINEGIISNSEVLVHLQDHLNDLYKTIGGNKDSITITPIPRRLRDLSKGMDIDYATNGAQAFSLSRHGMGTRSLAAVLTFRAYTTWQQKNAKDKKIHPMLALEEPESHLHPQAQRALFKQIDEIPGQRIISTHSPYIVSQAHISQCRNFRKDNEKTVVTQMDTTKLKPEDIRKIDRMVMNTRGDLLYARAIVLFEGETEEQAFPIFAERYYEQQPNALGISFIGVGGEGNYLPFLRPASNFAIPWYIFSDGEQITLKYVQKELAQIGISDYTKQKNVFVIPNGCNFESYLVAENYEDAILIMLDTIHEMEQYLDKEYIPKMDGQRLSKTVIRDYSSKDGRSRALVDVLSGNKTQYGRPIAETITNLDDENRRFPPLVSALFNKMSEDLNLPKRS